jgi:hypothetical protein
MRDSLNDIGIAGTARLYDKKKPPDCEDFFPFSMALSNNVK